MKSWLLVDDSPEEAAAFATRLSKQDVLLVEHSSANDAATALGDGNFAPAGVLMDVDLSNELGRQQTGPGMAQDIRVAQQKQAIPPFPIVRFSLREKVAENIGRDASSDDIFDLKIEKDGLSQHDLLADARRKLIGVRRIYDALEGGLPSVPEILSISEEQWSQWGSAAFQSDFELGDRVHLKAAPFVRMFVHPGLLIDEEMLAIRLGVSLVDSPGWTKLVDALQSFAYHGVSSECFVRWWARGLEDWWQNVLGSDTPLAGTSIGQRTAELSKHFAGLTPLAMPKGSMGDRPWRYCLLSREQRNETVPVDPTRAVKVKARSPMPSWLDPLYSALGVALQNREDPRLDREDLKRLQLFARGQ